MGITRESGLDCSGRRGGVKEAGVLGDVTGRMTKLCRDWFCHSPAFEWPVKIK
jgi:hypothetical protein